MEAKQIAKQLYDQVGRKGCSTDYCYSPNFKKWSKEMAINRAESNHVGDILKEIVSEIEKL